MAIAGAYNFSLQRGATDARAFQIKQASGLPMDLTSWTPRMQIRTDDGGEGTSTTTTHLLTLTPGTGLDITNAVGGLISLAMTPLQTQLINPNNERIICVYGIELFSGSPEDVFPLLQGLITILPEVVR